MRVLLLMALWPTLALAEPSTKQRARDSRLEAQELLDQLMRSQINVNTFGNRIKFIGEENYVCAELSDLSRTDGDPEQLRLAANVLASFGHPCAESGLIKLLGHSDGPTRMVAIQGLGRMHSISAASRLVPMLADPSLGIRREAARALGGLRQAHYGPALMKAAKIEGEPEVRAAMLIAVGASGDKSQTGALEGFLTHSSESARLAAAQGLCLLGAKKGLDFAKARLESTDHYDRLQALQLLEGAKTKEAKAVLNPLLKDKDHAVAAAAARMLYQGGELDKLDWLVVSSAQAVGDDKLTYEKEIEPLRLADDQRRAILRKAGIK